MLITAHIYGNIRLRDPTVWQQAGAGRLDDQRYLPPWEVNQEVGRIVTLAVANFFQ